MPAGRFFPASASLAPTLKVPTLADILMRTVTVSSLGKQQQARDAADLFLRPPVGDFGMLESTAMDVLIERGYAYTKERLATWPGCKAIPGKYSSKQ